MVNLKLRKQVAEARGWSEVVETQVYDVKDSHYLNGRSPDGDIKQVPKFDSSIDAIAQEFVKKGWLYRLESLDSTIDQVGDKVPCDLYYEASAVLPWGGRFVAPYPTSKERIVIIKAETGAIALCKLFLYLCEQEKENA